jgi:biopolymer transport protein ExbD
MSPILIIAFVYTLQQPIDGTALTFTVDRDSVTVRIGRWKIRTNKAADMNRFVDTHLKEMNPDNIVIYGDGAAKYKTFQSVIEVLKKHDWIRFRFEDTGRKPKPPVPKVETNPG